MGRDLMAALEASLQKAKGEGGQGDGVTGHGLAPGGVGWMAGILPRRTGGPREGFGNGGATTRPAAQRATMPPSRSHTRLSCG